MSEKNSRPDAVLARRGGAVEILRLPALLMGAATRLRNRLYDHGWLPAHRLQMPIVSVGNLTVGGTGKTPMVIWLARELGARGFRPGILSRGYKSQEPANGGPSLNDEGELFAAVLPDVLQVQQPDRVRGAQELERRGADVIVLDDGFQHRRLARDLDLVLIDATRPWGLPASEDGGAAVRAVLPRGLLREAPASLARATAIIITRADAIAPQSLAELERELERVVPGVARLLATHRPHALRQGARTFSLEALEGRAVQLVSGIGNPAAFELTARAAGADVRAVHAFPDHHAFTLADFDAMEAGVECLVTAKDAVKLRALGLEPLVLEVELEITRGAPILTALLDALPQSQRAREREAAHSGLHG